MRVYLPDVDPAAPDNAWRHRYFTSARYARYAFVAGEAIARLLGPVSAVRRPPASYPKVKSLLERAETDGSDEELLRLADEQLLEMDLTITDLREQVKERDESLDGLALDLAIAAQEHAEARRDVENLQRHVASLVRQLTAPDEYYTSHLEELPPATAGSVTEAVELARPTWRTGW